MANNPQVLIAGAGPVGMTLANELARHGVSVRIVDKSPSRTDKSKALVLWSRSLELLDDAGYAKDFESSGMRAHGAQISTGKEIVARIAFDTIDSRFPYALMIAQSETERVLEERLAARGVKVERTVELAGFKDDGNGITATLKKANGETETVTADWLAGCDGAHSTVRHALGMEFAGTTMESDWVLADGHIAGIEPKDRIHIHWHRDGILAFFPIVGDRYRVVADLGEAHGNGKSADPTVAEVQALLDRRGAPGMKFTNPIWLAAFRINERKVKEYRRDRVFLAGDAAHIHSPAGGQGMNTGMQDAFNLGWKLAAVIGGRAAPTLLDSYSPERSAVGDRVLRNAGRLTEAAVMRNPILQDVRNTIVRFATGFAAIQHKVADQLTEMDIGYPESPLSVTGHHLPHGAAVGARWAQPVAAGSQAAKFTAIGPADDAAALAKKYPGLVVAQPDTAPDHALRLIRPDGYVGFAGTSADLHRAEAYLATIAA